MAHLAKTSSQSLQYTCKHHINGKNTPKKYNKSKKITKFTLS